VNKKHLYKVAKIIAGQSPASSTYNSIGDGLPFFQGKADFQEKYPHVRMWCNSKKRKVAEPGDILMSVRAPVGSVNICNQKSIIGRGLSAIRPLSDLSGEFLYFFLKFNEQKIANLGTGSTFKAITQETLKNVEIPLPPLDDQIRIAHLLGKVEGLIARRKQHLQQLDDLLKSVFLEMFGDPVRNEKGWKKINLANLCEFENGDRSSNYPSGDDINNTGILFLSSREIVNFRLTLSNSVFISEEKFYSLNRGKCYTGDVLMVLRGAGLGKCCVFDGIYDKAFINAQMVILRCAENLNNSFLVEQIKNERIFRELLKVGSGSAQPQLTAAQVKGFKIVTPPIELQNLFAAVVGKVANLKSRYQQSFADLESLYGALSQKAFKGELDLSKVPLPAELPDNYEEEPSQPEIAALDNLDMIRRFSTLDTPAMSVKDSRRYLLQQWFEEWVSGATANEELSAERFWERARKLALDHWGEDDETDDFSAEDYDLFKDKLFSAIGDGLITQTRNIVKIGENLEFGNRIILKKAG